MSKKSASVRKMLSYGFLVFLTVVVLFPAFFMVLNSFIDNAELLQYYGSEGFAKLHFIPAQATIQAYVEILLVTPDYLMKFWNSIFIVSLIVAGQTIVACLGGYGFAKFHFPLKNTLLSIIIILMLMPYQVTLVPSYIVLDSFGLIGSYLSIILPGVFSVFGVFLLSQAFSSIPSNILEAAQIDGANAFQVFYKIVVPNGKMGIAAVVILTFIDNWNMVEQPLVFLRDPSMYPLSVFLSRINLSSLHIAFACGVLAMLPVTLLLLYMKEALVQGIEYAGLK